ncbi:hypothetical protein ISS03_02080 [Patescibacteria group bacterium]|nr:hypothetical protein [Patescibacteria group bacterium]
MSQIETHTQKDILDINKLLLSSLNKREQDIISRRFGLNNIQKQTLEEIGKDHNLTRERIRQLETAALKRIKELDILIDNIAHIKRGINDILAEYGGLIELNHLLEHLILPIQDDKTHKDIYKNNFYFVISRLLDGDINEVSNSKYLKRYIKEKNTSITHAEDIVKELSKTIQKNNVTLTTEELLNTITSLENHTKHSSKLISPNNTDISDVLRQLTKNDYDLVSQVKPLYSLLITSNNIEQNKLGHWGIDTWSEIKPRTINEKIYLILKENKKPMHFTKIAEEINNIAFDKKIANAATVHNDLILGERYVLVGRGMYTLTEWGYKKGTVTEIITDILKNTNNPLDKDAIIDEVLKQRLVKKTTVILALTNNKQFKKVGDFYAINDL